MTQNERKLAKQLLDKSREAFVMGLEVFNKPTLRYRVEGFVFFMCNAWELLLKAEIIKRFGMDSIYYKDNIDRTISLSDAIRRIFTNDKDPLRKNLEKIIELRNTSTHFITEEYSIIYAPLFQACVLNYRNKMFEFAEVDVAESIPDNFLTLSINIGDFSDESIKVKYDSELAKKLINRRNDLALLEKEADNPKFSISIRQDIYITKNKKTADLTVAIAKEAGSKVRIVKELKDPSNTHNYAFSNVVRSVNERISTEEIPFSCTSKSTGVTRHKSNKSDLNLFMNFYSLKDNETYTYMHKTDGHTPTYSYSPKIVDFVVENIKKDPTGIIEALKRKDKLA